MNGHIQLNHIFSDFLFFLQNYYLYLLSFALTADELCGAVVQYCTAPSAMLAAKQTINPKPQTTIITPNADVPFRPGV